MRRNMKYPEYKPKNPEEGGFLRILVGVRAWRKSQRCHRSRGSTRYRGVSGYRLRWVMYGEKTSKSGFCLHYTKNIKYLKSHIIFQSYFWAFFGSDQEGKSYTCKFGPWSNQSLLSYNLVWILRHQSHISNEQLLKGYERDS